MESIPTARRFVGSSACRGTASEKHTETNRCARRKTVNKPTNEAVVRPPLGSDSVHRVLVALPGIGAVVARVLDLRETDELQRADVDPADVELEPLRLELRAL